MDKFFIQTRVAGFYEAVKYDDIICLKGDRSYSQIHLKSGRMISVSICLSKLHEKIKCDHLLRVNRSYAVNINHIDHVCFKKGLLTLLLKTKEWVIVRDQSVRDIFNIVHIHKKEKEV